MFREKNIFKALINSKQNYEKAENQKAKTKKTL